MDLHDLVERRIRDVNEAFGVVLPVTWEIGPWQNFCTPRGFGVTLQHTQKGPCVVRLSKKLLLSPDHRKDGIVRHELGHVIDLMSNGTELDAWSRARGVVLPPRQHAELRADAIAHAVWGTPLKYDDATVQSTQIGTVGRPSHLGR